MRRFLIFCCLCLGVCRVHADEIVVLVDTGTEMPLARIEGNRVTAGLQFDLGQSLAQHLGRSARFLALPRKRLALALTAGQADVLCMYLPAWVPGPFDWSDAFFPQSEVMVSARRVARPASLADLAGQPIATVLGYVYPEMDDALGSQFVRADGPSTELNMQKLAAGRVDHALVNEIWFHWRLRQGGFGVALHPPLPTLTTHTACAVSRKGRVTLAQVNAALDAMQRDGSVAAVLRRY